MRAAADGWPGRQSSGQEGPVDRRSGRVGSTWRSSRGYDKLAVRFEASVLVAAINERL
ncbi:hypothetical protein ACFXDJ_32195 [Streptomyces sp. NPDC059443]|uniref:hypothetical protein n=1 Tax=unclassified Streptomyces TaxID=2593676 RepID=UPI0036A8C377